MAGSPLKKTMGKQNKESYYLNLLTQAINSANKPSEYETTLNQDYSNIRNFLTPANGAAPDYRDPLSKGVVTGMLPLAEYKKQRQQLLGDPSTDRDSLEGRQRALSDNQFEEDYGSAYADTLGQVGGQGRRMSNKLLEDEGIRNQLGVMGAESGLNYYANKKPGFWSTFLSNLAGKGAQFGLMALGGKLGKGKVPGGTVAVPPPTA